MNRTILIVICDFLLVSLLAFSTIDINKVADTHATRGMNPELAQPATNVVGGRQDLGDVMRLALEDERKKQDALQTELSQTRLTASQQQALLNQRESQLQNYQQQLQTREQQAAQLQSQTTNLMRQMTAAQNNIQSLNEKLRASTVETIITKEQRAALEAEAKQQAEKAAQLRQQLAALQNSNQMVWEERQRLANQLQLTEAQRQAANAQLSQAQQDLNAQRQQNLKLAEGVTALAGKSSELASEIRANRTLTPNTIFNELSTNRLTVNFNGIRPGFFGGETTKAKETQTILVTDGTNDYALCHLQDTLLSLGDPPTPWQQLSGSFIRGSTTVPIHALSFYLPDPRVALMPVSSAEARELGCKIYRIANDPYKFQDAVVVGAHEGYYGECQFQIDLTQPEYLKMDHNTLKGLFGKFNPSSGDLVFSRTGELLGVMANNTYCNMVKNFETSATFRANEKGQPIGPTLSSLYSTVMGLPFKLQ